MQCENFAKVRWRLYLSTQLLRGYLMCNIDNQILLPSSGPAVTRSTVSLKTQYSDNTQSVTEQIQVTFVVWLIFHICIFVVVVLQPLVELWQGHFVMKSCIQHTFSLANKYKYDENNKYFMIFPTVWLIYFYNVSKCSLNLFICSKNGNKSWSVYPCVRGSEDIWPERHDRIAAAAGNMLVTCGDGKPK